MKLKQIGHRQADLSVNSPILFFAREREIVDEAWPGDIIGIPNHGVLRVGDTLTEGETITHHRHPQLRAGNPAPRAAGGSDEVQAAASARSRTWPRRA